MLGVDQVVVDLVEALCAVTSQARCVSPGRSVNSTSRASWPPAKVVSSSAVPCGSRAAARTGRPRRRAPARAPRRRGSSGRVERIAKSATGDPLTLISRPSRVDVRVQVVVEGRDAIVDLRPDHVRGAALVGVAADQFSAAMSAALRWKTRLVRAHVVERDRRPGRRCSDRSGSHRASRPRAACWSAGRSRGRLAAEPVGQALAVPSRTPRRVRERRRLGLSVADVERRLAHLAVDRGGGRGEHQHGRDSADECRQGSQALLLRDGSDTA